MAVREQKALVIERIFDVPRRDVWKAWTEPEKVKKWWGPKAFRTPAVRIDFRVGGTFLNCMQSAGGPEMWQRGIWSTGVYREIIPLEKIVCTDSFADEEGTVVPASYYGMEGDFPLEMLVIVTFETVGDFRTRVTLTHEGFPTEEHLADATQGWNESFDKLSQCLGG